MAHHQRARDSSRHPNTRRAWLEPSRCGDVRNFNAKTRRNVVEGIRLLWRWHSLGGIERPRPQASPREAGAVREILRADFRGMGTDVLKENPQREEAKAYTHVTAATMLEDVPRVMTSIMNPLLRSPRARSVMGRLRKYRSNHTRALYLTRSSAEAGRALGTRAPAFFLSESKQVYNSGPLVGAVQLNSRR